MTQEILINVTPGEIRIALLENSVLQEVFIERNRNQELIGNIYKGRVNRLLPGIQAAFVDIGHNRSAFLHVSDLQAYIEHSHHDIRHFLKANQELLVQVYKEPLGRKGARLTTQLTIPSRYLVFTPGLSQISVSQKMMDENERQRLMKMITPDEQGGYIFRTAAEGVAQSEIDQDKAFLKLLWSSITERALQAKAGEIVYEEIPIALRVIRDLSNREVKSIRVDHPETAKIMRQYAVKYIPDLAPRIETYTQGQPIFDISSVEDELQKALQHKVYLKSGGYLIFDQTEAMTTIDVNTGSYLGSGDFEKTIFKTNLEAVDVIARQLRLRNLGGIIIIDFIDMVNELHKKYIMESLNSGLSKDSAKVQISELSSLGLVQLTRKRARESLEHILCVACPLCHQRGLIKSTETVCYEIYRELKRYTQFYPETGFLVIASEKVITQFKEEQSFLLTELEQLGKPIQFRVELSFTQEHFNILPLSLKE